MFLGVIRSARPQQPSLFAHSFPSHITRKPLNSSIRFARAESGPKETQDMDSNKQTRPPSKTEDSMSSFGEGYATRADEEGFGGTYGGNQYVGEEENVHGDATDHSQGSEVKEKEKGRNQEKISTQETKV